MSFIAKRITFGTPLMTKFHEILSLILFIMWTLSAMKLAFGHEIHISLYQQLIY